MVYLGKKVKLRSGGQMADDVEAARKKLTDELASIVLTKEDIEKMRRMAKDGRLWNLGFRWFQIRSPGAKPEDWELIRAEPPAQSATA